MDTDGSGQVMEHYLRPSAFIPSICGDRRSAARRQMLPRPGRIESAAFDNGIEKR